MRGVGAIHLFADIQGEATFQREKYTLEKPGLFLSSNRLLTRLPGNVHQPNSQMLALALVLFL